MTGICYGVSVGPGSAGSITLEALETIKKTDIIFLPSFPKEQCRAYMAAKESFPEIDGKDIRCETFTMSRDASVMKNRHEEIYEAARKELDAGRNIAFLTLGEVGLYSTYLYIHDRLLRNGYESKLISGISSVQEAADRLGIPLACGNEEIHIFPGTDNLEQRLSLSGTKVFMKPKKDLADAVGIITGYAGKHPGVSACGISDCGTENEVTAADVHELGRLGGYFTVIFVRENKQ